MLPKSERLHKVKANKRILRLPAEYSAPGSLEECHGVKWNDYVLPARGLNVECGCRYYPPPPLSCQEKEWSIPSTYCQSAMQGWTFVLLVSPHWLLDEGLVVHTYKLSKSDTNVKLDASLHHLGCSNWKNNNRHFICGIIDGRITVHRHRHRHHHHNHSSSGLLSSYCGHYCSQISGAVRHFHQS